MNSIRLTPYRIGIVLVFVLLVFGSYNSTANTGTVTLNIRTYIDGVSSLSIQGDTIQWTHLEGAAPGRTEDSNFPTYVNGETWFPTWPDIPDTRNFDCNCTSSIFSGVPTLEAREQTVVLGVSAAGYSASILQQPSAENDYTLIVKFDDEPHFGAAWYEISLFFNPLTFTVTSTDDDDDSNLGDGICDDGTGVCTLRAAFEEANAQPDANTIDFDIPGSGAQTILPLNPLPTIVQPVMIDGTTQPGATCEAWPPTLLIELNGVNTSSDANGLWIVASDSVVRGLVINRFSGSGVRLEYPGNNNTLECNFIGTDVLGTTALGNGQAGVYVYSFSENDIIGGTSPSQRNLISGNAGHGIHIYSASATYTVIQGNYIGTDASGTSSLGNEFGILVESEADGVIIGGTEAGAGNRIMFNGMGIVADGDVLIPLIQGNIISNNGIGIDVKMFSWVRLIGGIEPGAANTITRNSKAVRVDLVARAAILGNDISGKDTFSFNFPQIDLGGSFDFPGIWGPTPNDPGDGDVGANDLQNYPVITSFDVSTGFVTGTLNSAPNQNYRVEFFVDGMFASALEVRTNATGNTDFSTTLGPLPYDVPLTTTATQWMSYGVDVTSETSPPVWTSPATDAQDDYYTVERGGTLTVPAPGLLANDTRYIELYNISQPTHGTVVEEYDGSFTYTHDNSETTHDSFTYTIEGPHDQYDTATVWITITGTSENVPPVASDDAYNTVQANALNVAAPGVLGNDTDANNDVLTASLINGPSHAASFTLNPNGSFNYLPEASFFGEDTFTYSISDGKGGSDTATVSISVRENHPPITTDDERWELTGSPGFGTYVMTNDSDPDGDSLYLYGVHGDNVHGTFSVNLDRVMYQPDPGYVGDDHLEYEIRDTYGASATGHLTIHIFEYGSITVTKEVNWNGNTPDTNKTFIVCLDDTGRCTTFNYQGGTYTFEQIAPYWGPLQVTEVDPGSDWIVSGDNNIVIDVTNGSPHLTIVNTHVAPPPQPAIAIELLPGTQEVASGGTATFSVSVTNVGDVALSNIVVSDGVVADCGRSLPDLNPGDSQSYTCNGVVTEAFAHTAIVTGTPPVGDPVSDSDSASVTLPAVCVPNPEADLTGDLPSRTLGVITNHSTLCSYDVGMASYKRYDDNIDNQELFDSATTTIGPGQTVELNVSVPECALQVDLFYGEVLFSLANGVRYGDRLLANRVSENLPFCQAATHPVINIDMTPDTQEVASGGTATFSVSVTNVGDVALSNIVVSDGVVADCGRSLPDLNPGDSQSYTCSVIVTDGFTHTAIVTGTPPVGDPVSDSDSASVTLPQSCVPNPEADLTGDLPSRTVGVVTNHSTLCSYDVGMASYKQYDGNIDNQELFDWTTTTVGPGQTVELNVAVPECALQVDLFYGEVLFSLANGVRYGDRLLANRVSENLPYCEYPAAAPPEPETTEMPSSG